MDQQPVSTDFTAMITVEQSGDPAPTSVICTFGMKFGATDGFDDGTDVIALPAFPGNLNVTLDSFLSTSIKAPAATKDWPLKVFSQSLPIGSTTPNLNPVSISWQIPKTGAVDPTAVFQLLDSGGAVVVADMRSTTVISFAPSAANMEKDYTIRASMPTPVAHVLTVSSLNPGSGVSVTVTPADNNGQSNGTTPFTRAYNANTPVTVTAPSTAGGNGFQKWQRNGTDWATTSMATVTMDADYSLTAVYAAPNDQQPPAITSEPASNGTVNHAYSFTFTVTGNPTPSFGLLSGNLPPGVTLSASGLLSGTPTQAGNFTFTVQASNGVGQPATQAVNMVIAQAGNWITLHSGGATNFLGVSFVNATEGWIVGAFGTILHTRDGGTTFEQQSGPADWQYYAYYSVYFADPTNGWACGAGNGGIIVHTSDGGLTWSKQFVGGNGAGIIFSWITGIDSRRLWAASPIGLFYSSDGGATWQTNTTAFLGKILFITPQAGYGAGLAGSMQAGSMLTTTDGARMFTPHQLLGSWSAGDIAVVGSRVWVVGDRIDYSADGGITWVEQFGYQGHGFLRRVRFVNATQGWAFGDNGTILQTSDAGAHWTSEGITLQGNLWDASFVNGAGGWAVGDGGTILKYTGTVAVAPRNPFLESRQADRTKEFSLSVVTEPGRGYTLQGSTDLMKWLDLTNAIATGSSLGFIDPAATNFSTRFYRAVAH